MFTSFLFDWLGSAKYLQIPSGNSGAWLPPFWEPNKGRVLGSQHLAFVNTYLAQLQLRQVLPKPEDSVMTSPQGKPSVCCQSVGRSLRLLFLIHISTYLYIFIKVTSVTRYLVLLQLEPIETGFCGINSHFLASSMASLDFSFVSKLAVNFIITSITLAFFPK